MSIADITVLLPLVEGFGVVFRHGMRILSLQWQYYFLPLLGEARWGLEPSIAYESGLTPIPTHLSRNVTFSHLSLGRVLTREGNKNSSPMGLCRAKRLSIVLWEVVRRGTLSEPPCRLHSRSNQEKYLLVYISEPTKFVIKYIKTVCIVAFRVFRQSISIIRCIISIGILSIIAVRINLD